MNTYIKYNYEYEMWHLCYKKTKKKKLLNEQQTKWNEQSTYKFKYDSFIIYIVNTIIRCYTSTSIQCVRMYVLKDCSNNG